MKVRVICSDCNGRGEWENRDISDKYRKIVVCKMCGGTGRVQKEVSPAAVKSYLDTREERVEFSCTGCNAKEAILRPKLKQVPHGWVNWGGSMLCHSCKMKVIYAAILAANQKVQQMKENANDD